MVARIDGRIDAVKRYSKDFTKEIAVRIYKKNNTFDKYITKKRLTYNKDLIRQRGTIISEIDDYESEAPQKRYKKFSYMVEGKIGREYISATSMQYTISKQNVEAARREAWENFYGVLYGEIHRTGSDNIDGGEEEFTKLWENNKIQINEGFRYYHETYNHSIPANKTAAI